MGDFPTLHTADALAEVREDGERWRRNYLTVADELQEARAVIQAFISADYHENDAAHADALASAHDLRKRHGWVETDEARPVIGRADALADALNGAWGDWIGDTGCIPDCFTIHGPRTTRVEAQFERGNFAGHVLNWLTGAGYRLVHPATSAEHCEDPWVCCIHDRPAVSGGGDNE